MNHSFLISKGICPVKLVATNDSASSPISTHENPTLLQRTPLFSLKAFFAKAYPSLCTERLMEKYLKSYFGGSENAQSTPSTPISTNSSTFKKSAHAKHEKNAKHFAHSIPYYNVNSSEYLLTMHELYTLLFRIDENEFSQELHQMRHYLMNRDYIERTQMPRDGAMRPLERNVLIVVTSEQLVERLQTSLGKLLAEHAPQTDSLIHSIQIHSPQIHLILHENVTTDKVMNFLTTLLMPCHWKRHIQQFLLITHSGQNLTSFLDQAAAQYHNNNSTNQETTSRTRVRVAAHPRWLHDDLSRDLMMLHYNQQSSIALEPQNFEVILQAVVLPDGSIGASANTHDWWNVLQQFQLDVERSVLPSHDHNDIQICSRAYFKMDGALSEDARLTQLMEHASQQPVRAIDVGASPGGWVQRLCHFCSNVYAIDPGLLKEDLLEYYGSQIVHIPKKFETFVEEYSSGEEHSAFDLIACDMNADPAEVSRILLPFVPFLKEGAFMVLTLKLNRRVNSKAVERKFEQVKEVLGGQFCDFELHWLYANTANERTLVCRKKVEVA